MKHELWELQQMQSLPLENKINLTINRIIEWYEYWASKNEEIYLSWSGGKDSTVLKHIIKHNLYWYDIKFVFVDTGLEYPELKEFVSKDPDVVILHPSKPFWQVIRDYGYPVISKEVSECIENARKYLRGGGRNTLNITENCLDLENMPQRVQKIMGILKKRNSPDRSIFNQEKWKPLLDVPFKISKKCCHIMKREPLKKYNKQNKMHPMTAEMAVESRLRKQEWLKNGCNGFDMKEPKSMPMSFWTEQDVLEYIKKYNVEIPSIYGSVIEDTGIADNFEQLAMCDTGCKLKTTGCSRSG